jgi:hypothetical protein
MAYFYSNNQKLCAYGQLQLSQGSAVNTGIKSNLVRLYEKYYVEKQDKTLHLQEKLHNENRKSSHMHGM